MSETYIGRYVIQWEIGRGGMATVYLAHDPSMKRRVAVKVLPQKLAADPEFRDRFRREAEVVAALEHPYIVPVYDYGEHADQPYIVMRYMPGGSLARLLRRGPLTVAEAAHILERMAAALTEAHSMGVIHRDFKPENILYDQRDEPHLGDFGIVRILTGSEAITGGTIAGTAAYMSPEQVHADANVDGRADVYAMGVTLFEMLTTTKPYQGSRDTEVMIMHVQQPVPSILSVKADLPEGIEQVIHKAMAKNPDDRYQTPLEMADAVAAVGRQILSRRARRRLTADDVDAIYDALEDDQTE
jgi:serine/threonine protein kinase